MGIIKKIQQVASASATESTTPTGGNTASAAPPQNSQTTKKRTVPKLSELTMSPTKKPYTRLASSAPVQISLYKYSDDARKFYAQMPAEPLYQIILAHNAKPGILWKFQEHTN